MSDTWLPVMVFSILAFLVGLQVMNALQEAEAGHDRCSVVAECEHDHIMWQNNYYHKELLKEEQKQTALLDQIDCLTYYNGKDMLKCGRPLNITGVYHPYG